MSNRILRSRKNKQTMETITIVTTDESDCSNVTLKRSHSSEEYNSTDSEVEPKHKKQKLSSRKKVSAKNTTKSVLKNRKSKVSSKLKTKIKSTNGSYIKFQWTEDLLAEKEAINKNVARSMIKLFEDGNTIPFIARYRRHVIGDMTPEKVRYVKESYDEICELQTKSKTVLNTIEKSGKLTGDLKEIILNCKSFEELEHIYAPYKQGNKKSNYEKAKALGLEEPAISLLTGSKEVSIHLLIQTNGPEGLRNKEEVEKSISFIIGHLIAHNSDVLLFLRDLKESLNLKIATKLSSVAKNNVTDSDVAKFDHYYDNQFSVKNIQPHQVLAINRGESLKVLTVKVIIPDYMFNKFCYFCEQKWLLNGSRKYIDNRTRIIQETLKDIYSKNISPYIRRKTRTELKNVAHKAAIEVFSKNLKRLLLETPIKGKVIMGIDPGYQVGCKVAVISPFGDVLDTGVIYPHTNKNFQKDEELIRNLLIKHNCYLIALGNGKACRETESWLINLIKKNYFDHLDVSYAIVDESGASVYSCSDEARKEFSDRDPLQISAISLARRLQDPLAELVKIDPKSLGVGMYQHDLNSKLLDNTLNEVISECVSFVGVDLNTASHCLLRRIAGLTSQRADNIIKHRHSCGPFTNRFQLKDVKGIGDKIFEQCSGFLRIIPSNAKEAKTFYEKPETSPLDATDIHPEAYDIAEKVLEKFGFYYKQMADPGFINNFKASVNNISNNKLASEFNSTEQTIKLIIDALSKPLAYDLRTENVQGPIFKKDITTIADLRPGLSVTGRVTNVVAFGAFVDIGVGKNGLLHKSRMKGYEILLGQRVQVKVLNIENNGNRIGLEIENIL